MSGSAVYRRSLAYSAPTMELLHPMSAKFARSGKPRDKQRVYSRSMSKITVIALGVSDLAKSVAFYRDKAQFELQNLIEDDLAFFSAGTVLLMLNRNLRRP